MSKAALMMRDHASGHGTNTECAWQPRPFKGRSGEKKKKEREQEEAMDDPKGLEEHSLVVNKHQILNGGKKRTQFGGPKERKARKVPSKGNDGFQ